MRKTIIVLALIVISLLGIVWFINNQVDTGTTIRQSKDAAAGSEANAEVSREAKEQGESATVRADESKLGLRKGQEAIKEKLRENFTSYDDKPLPDDVVVELCRAYNYEDCIRLPTEQPTPGNKG